MSGEYGYSHTHHSQATRRQRAGLDKNPRDVARMFDAVARRYDVTNTLLSGGQDRLWRIATRRALNPIAGERVLDLAAGTGVSTVGLARTGAWCLAVDFSLGMLRSGQRRGRHRTVSMVAADALHLPFADASFDAATISFGLRNLADPQAGLAELARVTRPGGRLVVCEFSTPTWAPLAHVYRKYLTRGLPKIAEKVSSNPDAYVYLAESIQAWPDQRLLAEWIASAGWVNIAWRNLTGGIVALHRARRPSA